MKKKFTNFMTLLLAMGMILSLTACGTKDAGEEKTSSAPSTEQTEQTEPQSTEKPQSEPLPVSANLEDYKVTILSAEEFDTDEGGKGIRFYYDFTNNSKETIIQDYVMQRIAMQDGSELEEAYADDDSSVPEERNSWRLIRPGVTARCAVEYAYNPKGGAVSYRLEAEFSDDVFQVDMKPSQLTGRPAEDFVVQPVADPMWTKGMSIEGVHHDDYPVKIERAEIIHDGTAVRVYFSFTNNSDKAVSPNMKTNLAVYQDGLELFTVFPKEQVNEDIAFTEELEPGATVTASQCYELFSNSPIEVEFREYGNHDFIGTVFPLK